MHDVVVDDDRHRQNRMAPWLQKAQSKKHNLPKIKLEDNRIKLIETRIQKQMVTDPEDYNRIKRESGANQEQSDYASTTEKSVDESSVDFASVAEGSVKTITSGDCRKLAITVYDAGKQTFNVLPQPDDTRLDQHPQNTTINQQMFPGPSMIAPTPGSGMSTSDIMHRTSILKDQSFGIGTNDTSPFNGAV